MNVKTIAIPLPSEASTKTFNRLITSVVFVLAVVSIHSVVEHDRPSSSPFSVASVSIHAFPSAR